MFTVMDVPELGALHGRTEICSPVPAVTRENLVDVLNKALGIHNVNSANIDYLWNYMRGKQPILNRTKTVRAEICNKIVENHAAEIAQFTSAYFLGEPVTYVRRGGRDDAAQYVERLNDFMFFEDKASHDKELATWLAVCGVAYRMCLPDRNAQGDADEAPFELDTPDPRNTFVVYHTGFGHRPLMGVRQIWREPEMGHIEMVCCVYTDTMYYEVRDGVIIREEPHYLGAIPIFEYRLNQAMLGSFEPAIPLLDAINTISSNRVDGIEQFIQSFLKFKNCDVDGDKLKEIRDLGAIVIKTSEGMDGDVDIIAQELNQTQTQTLVDYMYDQVLVICGLPTTTKGGASTSDTGAAVFLRDGWSQCEARARDTEMLFKRSEKQFLKMVLRIINGFEAFPLSLSEVECKFTRRQHDNLLTKTQSLQNMLESGLHPEVAIATCGLFNDPQDVAARSKDFLRKWDYVPIVEPEITVTEDDE